jgi:hypothetical protein
MRTGLLAAVAAGVAPSAATGGVLDLVPEVEVGGTYETNPRFLPDCDQGLPANRCGNQYVMGTFLDARVRGSWRTPDSEISLTPRVRDWNYLESNKDLNNNDIYVDGSASRRFQRAQAALLGLYSDTLIRQQVFESPTPTDPDGPPPDIGGAGQVADDGATQRRWLARPTFSYKVSERNELGVQYEYSEVTFDQGANPNFFDFDSQSIDLSLTHSLGARAALRAGVYGSTFDANNADRALAIQQFSNTTDSYGVNASYEFAYSETISVTAQLGTARNSVTVETPFQGSVSTSDTTLLGNLGIRQRSEKTVLNVDIGRSQVPRSDGRQITQDQIRIYVDRKITGQLNGRIGLIALDQSGIGDFDRFDQTYYAVDLSGAYRIARDWTEQTTYRFQTNDSRFQSVLNLGQNPTVSDVEQANRALFVSVVYRGVGIRR